MRFWPVRKPQIKPPLPVPGEPLERTARPRIVVSLDRSWINLLGIGRIAYRRLILRAGGIPMWVDYGSGPEPPDIGPSAEAIVADADGLILSGGVDVDPTLYGSAEAAKHVNPRRDRFELALLEHARRRRIPIVGICRGCQLLNVSLGGTLTSIPNDPGLRRTHRFFSTHSVLLDEESTLGRLLAAGRIRRVRSLHGQVVAELGECFRIVARAPDGVPEAIECAAAQDASWMVGVQWHPELKLFVAEELSLFREFVRRAGTHRARTASETPMCLPDGGQHDGVPV